MRRISGWLQLRHRQRIRRLTAGLAAVATLVGVAAIPTSASRAKPIVDAHSKRCKVISPPQVVGGAQVGQKLHARHGSWQCPS
jgi:hypothetical protein